MKTIKETLDDDKEFELKNESGVHASKANKDDVALVPGGEKLEDFDEEWNTKWYGSKENYNYINNKNN